jgi:molybdopterin/thiamine biosynthesis adenylyltransferase
MNTNQYNYSLAFSRNLGFVSKDEQRIISQKKISIPGMGGVGGYHLHTLARLGFKHFHIADLDNFDVHNFNRQIGAKVSTLGKSKVEVMRDLFLDIVPDGTIKLFSEGVNAENRESFLEGVDLVVDGLDVYVIKERLGLFDLAHKKGIPVLTAGPLGMGTCIITFDPNGMKFSDYFNINEKMEQTDLLAHFISGINPKPMFLKYLFFKDEIDLQAGQAPSLHTGVLAATTAVGSEVFKIILGRGPIKYAPRSTQYDFYFGKIKNNWLPWGNKNPKQKILIKIIKSILLKKKECVEG